MTPAGLAQEVADWLAGYLRGRPVGVGAPDEMLQELRREVTAVLRLAQIVERERCAVMVERAGHAELAARIRRRRP